MHRCDNQLFSTLVNYSRTVQLFLKCFVIYLEGLHKYIFIRIDILSNTNYYELINDPLGIIFFLDMLYILDVCYRNLGRSLTPLLSLCRKFSRIC